MEEAHTVRQRLEQDLTELEEKYQHLLGEYHNASVYAKHVEDQYQKALAQSQVLQNALSQPKAIALSFVGDVLNVTNRQIKKLINKPTYYPDITLKQWLVYHHKEIVFNKCFWMGVRAFKNPLDSWIYQEMLYEIKPDVIVEIGSAEGGSTLYFAQMLDLLGKGQVISIDIDRSHFNISHDRVITITGKSASPEVVAQVAEICHNKSVLVIHDADHHKQPVLDDMEIYAKFVNVGSYLIIEDGIVDLFTPEEMTWDISEGPLAASDYFVQQHPEFVVDKERERYLLTYNPRGYLKRIR